MKKALSFMFCAIMAIPAFIACNPEDDKADGKAEIKSMVLSTEKNTFLSAEVAAIIDMDTLRLPLPAQFKDSVRLAPTFVLSKGDVIMEGESTPIGDDYTFILNDTIPVFFTVVDEASAATTKYTVKYIDNDGKAELTGIVFSKQDNDKLDTDYAPNTIAADLAVSIPGELIGNRLVATVSATLNDEIIINKEKVGEDGKITIDTSFPLDIEVKDVVSNVSTKYTLRFSKNLTSWTKVAEFGDSTATGFFHMAMGSTAPYITYLAYPVVGGVKETSAKISVKKFDGSALTQVGAEGFSAGKVTAAYITVNANDVPSVFYIDGSVSSKGTVQTFDGSKWSVLGNAGVIDKVTGLFSNYKSAITTNPATGYPIVATTTNVANTSTGSTKRGASVSIWDGSAWSANKPINGRTEDYGYTPRATYSSDAAYVLICNQNANPKGYSVYKYASSAWSTYAPNFSLGGSDLGTTSLAVKCDGNGVFYAALADNSTGSWLCTIYKFDENGAPVKAFNTLPGVTFGNTSAIFDFDFDSQNNPVVAYITEDLDLKVLCIDPDTKTWGQAYKIAGSVTGGYLGVGVDSSDNIYVCSTAPGAAAKQYTISLYKGSYAK